MLNLSDLVILVGLFFRLTKTDDKGYDRKMTKRIRVLREIGKVAVNFGSLTFASLVLGTIIRGDYDRLLMLLAGGGLSALLIVLGIICLSIGGEEK